MRRALSSQARRMFTRSWASAKGKSLRALPGGLPNAAFRALSVRSLSSVNMYSDDRVKPGEIKKVLIANRGEIACRVIQTLKKLNVRTVAIYSDADAKAAHVQMADEAYRVGPPASKESYLLGDRILDIAESCGAQAIHPGYGFLSENRSFAEACAQRNIKFMGPPASAIHAMGCKRASKELMEKAGVPVVPGYYGEEQGDDFLKAEADKIGYPLLIKAEKGGGGKGMRIVRDSSEFTSALQAAQREAINSFGDGRVLLERYLQRPRHIEVQVFADQHGNIVHLFERDCSVQRRYQKVLEESPAPGITEEFRRKIGQAAVAAAAAVGYEGAGTVEFIVDTNSLEQGKEEFFFMEMNTRLQVEHPVTEMVTKQDLVAWQLHVAAGNPLPFRQEDLAITGHAIEARIYAESPENNFLPQTGRLVRLNPPAESPHVRVDTGVREGDEVSVFYDPMIAKLIVWDKDRSSALRRLSASLQAYQIVGLKNNIDFVNKVACHPAFVAGDVDTSFIEKYGSEILGGSVSAQKRVEQIVSACLFAMKRNEESLSMLGKQSRHAQSPWASLTDFRSGVPLERHFRFHDHSDPVIVRFNASDKSYSIHVGDRTLVASNVVLKGDGHVTATLLEGGDEYRGQRLSAHVIETHKHGEGRSFTVFEYSGAEGAGKNAVELLVAEPEYLKLEGGAGAAHGVTAPMPGKIIKTLVAPGTSVKKGTPLLIMEAMKMEHTIVAPEDAIVDGFSVTEGEFVDDGKVLVNFEE